MLRDKRAQCRRAQPRHVAVADQDVAGEYVCQCIEATSGRITGAALTRLRGEHQVCRARQRPARRVSHFVGVVADDDYDRPRADARERAQRPRHHWLARKLMEHLRARRAHSGAESGGEYYRGKRPFHGLRHNSTPLVSRIRPDSRIFRYWGSVPRLSHHCRMRESSETDRGLRCPVVSRTRFTRTRPAVTHSRPVRTALLARVTLSSWRAPPAQVLDSLRPPPEDRRWKPPGSGRRDCLKRS